MYHYHWYQWLLFFFCYSFLGWVLESCYVSFLMKRWVNRGFMRGPMLPIYGTGAVLMLYVSLPVQNNLPAVYLAGVFAATLLELVTGWIMEKIFKVRYWDYTDHRFNFHGYICLSSSLAWGFLTILLTEVLHLPIEKFILNINSLIALSTAIIISVIFLTDFVSSFKAAWDLGQLLQNLTKIRSELDDLQVQLNLLKAEAKADLTQKLADFKADSYQRLSSSNPKIAELHQHIHSLSDKRQNLLNQKKSYFHKSLLNGNPSAASKFEEALKDLKKRYEKF